MLENFVGQADLHVDVAPIRAAYLVRRRHEPQIREAMTFASQRWGGVQEMIVEVPPSGRLGRGYRDVLKLVTPDFLVDLAGLTADARQTVAKATGLEVRGREGFDQGFDGINQLVAHSVADLTGTTVVNPDADTILAVAGPGRLVNEAEVRVWRDFGAGVVPAALPPTAEAQIRGQTVLARTVHQVSEVQVEGWFGCPSVVWVGLEDSLRDALEFWNFRAVVPRVLGAAVVLVAPAALAKPGFQSALWDHIRGGPSFISPDVCVVSHSVPRKTIVSGMTNLGYTEIKSGVGMHVRSGLRNFEENPLTFMVGLPVGFVSGSRTMGSRQTVTQQFFKPSTALRLQSPVKFSRWNAGPVKVRFSGPSVLDVPAKSQVAQLFHPNARWDIPGSLLLNLATGDEWTLNLNLPDRSAVLNAALASAGQRYQLSTKGSYANGVMRLAGGLEVFKDPRMTSIIRTLTTPRSKSLVKDLAALRRGSTTESLEQLAQKIGIQVRRRSQTLPQIASAMSATAATVGPLLNQLVGVGLVRRGVTIRCPVCAMETFARLDASGSIIGCPACGADSASPEANQHTAEPIFHYELDPLVDRASDNGVLPHLYALASLGASEGDNYFEPGADIWDAAGTQHELDVLGFSGKLLIAGEAKISPDGYSRRSIARDVRVSKSVGADQHLMICVSAIPKELLDAAADACARAHIDLRVIDPQA